MHVIRTADMQILELLNFPAHLFISVDFCIAFYEKRAYDNERFFFNSQESFYSFVLYYEILVNPT